MLLDPRTFIVTFIAGNLLMVLLLAVAFRGRQDTALKLWIASLIVQSLGWGLMLQCAPGSTPDFALLGFGCLSTSFAILTWSLARFFNEPPRYAWPAWPVPLAILLFALSEPGSHARHAVANGMAAVQMVMAAFYLLRPRPQWLGLRAVMAGSGLMVAALLALNALHMATTAQLQPVYCIPAADGKSSFAYLAFFIARFSFLFGFLLLMEARQRADVTRLATLDPLTEAYNRRSFMELADKELSRCQRNGHPLSLLFIDLDHFKRLNDQHGHQAGDRILRRVKLIADECLRRGDLFGRYGGEEFCLLAPDTDQAGAQLLAERFRVAIEQDLECRALAATASIGMATLDPVREDAVLTELIEAADQALYRAKSAGRNRVAR